MFTRTKYEVAFQNLDSADASGIMQYLDGAGISYKLSTDGSNISVPSASASKVKVEVGSQGLIQNGSIGFAELSKSSSSIGTTDKEFDVKYRNALNGEIQQLLLNKQGIAKVKANVNLPQPSVFLNDSNLEKASASIVITFKTGFRPKQEEIDSYYNLVKSAVPNLAIEDINISGSASGDLIPSGSISGLANSSALFESQMAHQNEFDNRLKRDVQQFLSQIVGMDNIVVSVISTLNFDKKQSQENLVQPLPNNDNRGIEISRHETSETFEGTDGQSVASGTGETEISNFPTTGGAGTSTSEKTSSVVNYEVSRVINNIDYGPYKVKDLSINVAIDSSVMTDERRSEIQNVLLSSVRVLLAQSDLDLTDEQLEKRVSVISQAFMDSSSSETGFMSSTTIWWAALALLAVALAGGGGYYLARRRKQQAAEALDAMPQPVELPTIDIESVTNESQVRKQLESLAKRKPDEFVNLLRTWLVDE